MGGGASSQGLEDVIQETFQLGRALVSVSFPGMYRIYDFHSSKAPKIKNSNPFSLLMAPDSDEEEEEAEQPAEENYKDLFHVTVGGDVIYFDDVNEVNDAGWTALHTCCMSYQTVEAGIALIKEMSRLNGNLDEKTITGPGAFNAGWSPLHMACAYGVEPLVVALIEHEANVNTVNSYSCSPLLEACHRGFVSIVKILARAGADLSYNPSSKGSNSSPFVCSPSQAALAEASRCGFNQIVECLIENGAEKDQRNHLKWTALHEACFYNRIEVVKLLLFHGADPSLRTKCGALPYHLASLNCIRDMLKEMGGDRAVPGEGDVVDMMVVMRELTVGSGGKQKMMVFTIDPETGRPVLQDLGDEDEDEEGKGEDDDQEFERIANEESRTAIKNSDRKFKTPEKQAKDSKEEDSSGNLLHSGGVLGDLPNLPGSGSSPSKVLSSTKKNHEFNTSMHAAIDGSSSNSLSAMLESGANISTPQVDGGKKKKKGKKEKKRRLQPDVPADLPKEFICNLTQRQMTDPVRTVYGNIYERAAILDWFKNQGHLCPMTGAPLAESDLADAEDIKKGITKWMLLKSMENDSAPTVDQYNAGVDAVASPKVGPASHTSSQQAKTDDLYDF